MCPGSHRRPNSEAEVAGLLATTQLSERYDGGPLSTPRSFQGSTRPAADTRAPCATAETNSGPIGEAVPVRLKAGDGVIYINTILHWGSECKCSRSLCVFFRSLKEATAQTRRVCADGHFTSTTDALAVRLSFGPAQKLPAC